MFFQILQDKINCFVKHMKNKKMFLSNGEKVPNFRNNANLLNQSARVEK